MRQFSLDEIQNAFSSGTDHRDTNSSQGDSPSEEHASSSRSLLTCLQQMNTDGHRHSSAVSFSYGMLAKGVPPAAVGQFLHAIVGGDGGTRSEIDKMVVSAVEKQRITTTPKDDEFACGLIDRVITAADIRSVQSLAKYLCAKRIPEEVCERLLFELNPVGTGVIGKQPIKEAVRQAYVDPIKPRFGVENERIGKIEIRKVMGVHDPIPPLKWLVFDHFVKGFVSATNAPGGLGKSQHLLVEAISLTVGRNLFDGPTMKCQVVWVVNLEDPDDQIRRRIQAICKHYKLTDEDIGGRLYVSSARDEKFVLATTDRDGLKINTPRVEEMKQIISEYNIDLVMFDPFVQLHRVQENSNEEINAVISVLRGIADECNVAVEIVGHTRKINKGRADADSARGARALTDGVRALRVINHLDPVKAKAAGLREANINDYYQLSTEKANLRRRGSPQTFKRVSVPLKNATTDHPADEIGVPVAAELRAVAEELDRETTRDLLAALTEGDSRTRYHYASNSEWVGCIIAEIREVDRDEEKASIQRSIEKLIDAKLLEKIEIRTTQRKRGSAVIVGPKAESWLQCDFNDVGEDLDDDQ